MLCLCWTLLTLAITTSGKSLSKSSTLTPKDRLLLREIECLLEDEALCDQDSMPQQSNAVKNTIYFNGNVYTVDGTDWDQTPKEAIVVQDGKVAFVGSNQDALEYVNCESSVLDLNGATVLPGFHDVHIHPLEASSRVGSTCKLTSDTDPELMKDIFKTCAPRQIGTEWVLGGGHSITSILDHIEKGGRPPREIIDEVLPDVPVVMLEETSHSVWVNSEALRRANITKWTPVRPGGVIMREEGTGEPNGILLEDEGVSIMEFAMKPTPELEELNYEGLIDGLWYRNENGITSVSDARVYWGRGNDKTWERVCKEGKLTVRANLALWAYPQKDDSQQIEALKDMFSNENPNCFLRKNQIKVYIDGLLDSTTAAMEEPYVKNLHLPGISDNRGLNIFDQPRLAKYVKELQNFDNNKRYDFLVHAIGDRGVHQALNAFDESWISAGTRHRMTHLEQVKPEDMNRFQKLNVIADFQVAGNFTKPSTRDHIESLVGKDRAHDFIPLRSVYHTNAHVTLSSDWDVSTINPFVGIQNAISRGHQSVNVKDAVEMYTINAAFAMRQEHVVGSLATGKDADLVVIDTDIMDQNNEDVIHKTRVLQTVLAGEEVYSTEDQNQVNDVTCEVFENRAENCQDGHYCYTNP
ncbi:putative amidohydrolase YtcJ [Crassostrea angulata]|uniref:putative amidohydrolase YtcJ n=1 Tax=Magallana angulata TaxID=2784310 RepID=UPI0022B09366|nr:putative amidohydrolase YtcJ [Crassostrea angulata]